MVNFLLSRINGDAPRASKTSGGVLDSTRAGCYQLEEAALLEHPNANLRCYRYIEAI